MEIYSNFNHQLNYESFAEARETGAQYQHSAWNFCGQVRWDRERRVWSEDVWVFRRRVDTLEDEDLLKLIKRVNDKYGHD